MSSTKRRRSARVTAADAQKAAKIAKLKDDASISEHPLVEEWMLLENKEMCTLTVHIKAWQYSSAEYLGPRQSYQLKLHCCPGILVCHSNWFAAVLKADPGITEIVVPDTCTYREIWKGRLGYIAATKDEIILAFGYLHSAEWIRVNFNFALLLIFHYLDCPMFSKRNDKLADNIIELDTWRWLAFADHFNCDALFRFVCRIRSRPAKWSSTKEELQLALDTVSKKTLMRMCIDITV